MSELATNKISPVTGTTVTLGDSGDTFTIASGASISGDGSALTTLTSGNLTGALPAISGAALTNLPAGGYTELGVAATTSGSAVAITGIPAAVKTVLIILNKVSLTGAAEINMQLGDSGGIETSGYVSGTHKADGNTLSNYGDTAHFGLANGGGGADPFSTVMNLTRSASGVHDWAVTWQTYQSSGVAQNWGVGTKTLSGELTQINLLTNGTFDAGNWNAYYQ